MRRSLKLRSRACGGGSCLRTELTGAQAGARQRLAPRKTDLDRQSRERGESLTLLRFGLLQRRSGLSAQRQELYARSPIVNRLQTEREGSVTFSRRRETESANKV